MSLFLKLKSIKMELLGQLSLIIHIIAGGGMLLFAPIAFLINVKNKSRHILAGKIFNYCMAVVGVTSLIGILKNPTNIFLQFLFAIAILTAYSVVKGVRAIQIMKGSEIKKFDFICLSIIGMAGLGLLIASFYTAFIGDFPISVSILFGVFGFFMAAEVPQMWKVYSNPSKNKLDWFRIHIGSMMGAFIASCTAFTVNAVPHLPMLVKWFGPTIILMPLAFYYGRKFAPKKKKA